VTIFTCQCNNNSKKSSNFGRGHIATPSGRPTQSHHTQSFICICQVALMWTPSNTQLGHLRYYRVQCTLTTLI